MALLTRLAAILLAATPAAAQAHVVADPQQGASGAYQPVRFRVGHGCGEAATTAVRVEIPAGLETARPQPKPGWRLSVERDGTRTAAVTWEGLLPADQFDEFAVLLHLPAGPATLTFPITQTCGATQERWDQPPSPDARPERPAPTLVVAPPAATAPSNHQHQH